jgi:phage terminase large subunit-like protein
MPLSPSPGSLSAACMASNAFLTDSTVTKKPASASRSAAKAGGEIDEEAFTKGTVYGGLDLAETTDLCAFVLIALWNGIWHVKAWFWKPANTLADHVKRDRAPYDVWERSGFIEAVPGVAVDYEYIARKIAEICEPLTIAKIAYDRFRFKTLEAQFQKLGVKLPFEPFGQTSGSTVPARTVSSAARLM